MAPARHASLSPACSCPKPWHCKWSLVYRFTCRIAGLSVAELAIFNGPGGCGSPWYSFDAEGLVMCLPPFTIMSA